MGKRERVIVLSSDDEDDDDRSLSSKRSYRKPKLKPPLATRTIPRESKRPRISSSRTRLSRESSNANVFKLCCEDFEDLMSGCKVSAGDWKEKIGPGFGRSNSDELWVDKYKPRFLEDLAVHKKKVQEVKMWFEERIRTPKENIRNQVLILTGQSGVGKSASIHVIASHFGATLCEWNTPTPTIWQEHLHTFNAGLHYTSKLDEFVNFIEKIRKYGVIPSSLSLVSKPSIVLLIDDLPVTNGRAAFERLQNCLLLLIRSAKVPTIILVTHNERAESADHMTRSMEELELSLENAGACKVAFNPITNNSIKKTLTKICREEQCNVTAEQIDLIAQASGGDIRHAITSLQLFCVEPERGSNASLLNYTSSYSLGKADESNSLVSGSLLFGRDETLSLFHALGKFLHNKRDTEAGIKSDQGAFLLEEKFCRLPLKMDTPEKVLSQAHGQARPIADFLHENVLDFLSDEAMEDTWDVTSYLSDADLLLSSFRGTLARYNEAESLFQSAAASVAVRGVLFGNGHPLPSRWHSVRRPRLWHVERSMLQNQGEMMRGRFVAYGGSSFSFVSELATEHMPALKWLKYRSSGVEGNETDDECCDKMSLDDTESKSSDDEIEDW
uniref:Cell cycle checkpoint protein RAD17 n=1 Tax=Rhizophora mucronata TaxID=61149 RepID=A0A2P2J5G0_RHIMU